MVAKLVNTVLYLLLFLLALLLIIRMIRSKEGFQNQTVESKGPKEEQYDLDLFFKNYPIDKVCEIYNKGFPTVVSTFSMDDKGEKVPDSVAKLSAMDYLKNTLTGGIVQCPFSLPKDKSLKSSYDFVMKLDENVLVKAMSTLIFFAANLQLTANTTKQQMKSMEGFISECSADELEYRLTVPLQCIPADVMKATQQEEINAVDKFEMEQRVSQKAQIAKKLGTLVKNLQAFQKEFNSISKDNLASRTRDMKNDQANVDYWTNPPAIVKSVKSEEDIENKKMEYKSLLESSKNDVDLYTIYVRFSFFSMKRLVDTYTKLQKEIEGAADQLESGIPGAPKS